MRNASLTAGDLMRLLRERFSMSSRLVAPELRHAILGGCGEGWSVRGGWVWLRDEDGAEDEQCLKERVPVETVGNKVGDNIEPGGVTIRGVEDRK